MPTREHEFWLELIEDQPSFATALLRWVGVTEVSPAAKARVESAELAEYNPTEYRADKVVSFYAEPTDERPELAVIVESQRAYTKEKYWSWPAYVTNLRARRQCTVLLVVVCPSDIVADRCRRPIELGNPGSVLCPLVIGPSEVPVITDRDEVADPLDLVASAAVHGAGPDGEKVFGALLDLIDHVEPDQAQTYIDNVLAVQPEDARRLLEMLMTAGTREHRFKSDFFRRIEAEGRAKGMEEGRAEGRAEGEARAIVEVLAGRGLAVSDEVQDRIISCTDIDQLRIWLRRVATVESAEELFD